jgi:chromosome segregation ATPase
MDFKALSITILPELAETTADKDYIAGKLRACIDQDPNALYDVMESKYKTLHKANLEYKAEITTLTKKSKTDSEKMKADFEKEKKKLSGTIVEKDAILTQAQTAFNQIRTEMDALRSALQTANAKVASLTSELNEARRRTW